jgi:hypothetical protein
MVKKLVRLVSLFRESEPDIELFLSGDPEHLSIPPLILFTLVDVIFRHFDKAHTLPEIHIEASGFSNLITFQLFSIDNSGQKDDMDDCCRFIRQIEACYAGKVPIYYRKHSYGCSVFINTVHSNSSVIHKEEAPAD